MFTYIRFGLMLLNIVKRIMDHVEKAKDIAEGERRMAEKIRKQTEQSVKDAVKLRNAMAAATDEERRDILKS